MSDYVLDLKQEVEKEEIELLEIERELELTHCGYDDRDTTPLPQRDNYEEPRENYADFNPQYSW